MTFREIDAALLELVDEETGEIKDIEAFKALSMERDKKAENMALWVLDLKDEINSLTAEIDRLKQRKKAAENKVESLRNYLPIVLAGEKLKTPIVSVSYRKSESVELADKESVILWAQKNNHEEILKYSEPEISKTAVKTLLADGIKIPGAAITNTLSTIIK